MSTAVCLPACLLASFRSYFLTSLPCLLVCLPPACLLASCLLACLLACSLLLACHTLAAMTIPPL